MEALHLYGAKDMIFQLASVGQCLHIVGCYFAPDDASTIDDVVAAISQQPKGAALLVVGNFNTNLAATEGRAQDEEVAADMDAA